MKYLWYAFLGLFSLGFLGVIAVLGAAVFIISSFGQDLPDYSQLKEYKPAIVTRLYAGDGRLMAEFAQEKRVFVPIEKIPDLVKHAFIAAEDQNFYKHEGVDVFAILRAGISNIKNRGSGKRPIGASTITQQVAKNFLLGNEVSYKRKIREAILAYRMERAISKDHLLELYLNGIFLGARSYGVAAAAQQYFDKSLDDLTPAEAAYLAALPKAPNNYNPVRHHQAAVDRRNWVLGRMREDGYITSDEMAAAVKTDLTTIPRDESRIVNAPYFAEEVRRELYERFGADGLYKEGMAVRTSIDPALQKIAEESLRKGLMAYDRRHGYRGPLKHLDSLDRWQEDLKAFPRPQALLDTWRLAIVLKTSASAASLGFVDGGNGAILFEKLQWARKYMDEGYALGPEIKEAGDAVKTGDIVIVQAVDEGKKTYELMQIPQIQGAVMALDPHTGRVLAMQGGWKRDISEFNRATQAKRQPGSSIKPFVYLAALDKGYTPTTLIQDAPFMIQDRPGHFWSPQNYTDDFLGPTPLRIGVEKSRNLMTVRLAEAIGMDTVAEYAQRFGIMDNMPHQLSYAIGAGETTLYRMTAAYAVLVNGGKKVTPTLIDRIQDRRGNTIFRHDDRDCLNCGTLIKWENQTAPEIPDTRAQIEDPRTSYQMVSIMEGVVQRGTATKLKSLGTPLAGKTGTTNKSKDTWFIGFTPDLVVGVFMGFDEPRSLGKRETGATVALPVFKSFMEDALKDVPPMPFRVPPGVRHILVNAHTGHLTSPDDPAAIWEAFVSGTEPNSDGDNEVLDPAQGAPPPEDADENGNLIPPSTPAQADNGVYGPHLDSGPPDEEALTPQPLPSYDGGSDATTGTGGLY